MLTLKACPHPWFLLMAGQANGQLCPVMLYLDSLSLSLSLLYCYSACREVSYLTEYRRKDTSQREVHVRLSGHVHVHVYLYVCTCMYIYMYVHVLQCYMHCACVQSIYHQHYDVSTKSTACENVDSGSLLVVSFTPKMDNHPLPPPRYEQQAFLL